MPMLADCVDAVVGVDTHRAEIAHRTGVPLATTAVSNDSAGYAELLAWIVDYAPGSKVVVAVEGSRSYGTALTRALTEAGMTVLECEQPTGSSRRGRPKSDGIDAHLAVLSALQLKADQLPSPRADGDREALRVLLTARAELTTTSTGQTNRHRLNRSGDRDLNRAIHTIAIARMRCCPTTRAYVERRRAEGKNTSEIRRCLIGGVWGPAAPKQRVVASR